MATTQVLPCWAERLTSNEEVVYNEAWKDLFLNPRAVKKLLSETSQEVLHLVLQAGQNWEGGGWDSTKCAKTLRQLTGVALVSPRAVDYVNAFLYSLVLAANLDVTLAELSDKCADVAFHLSDLWCATGEGGGMQEDNEGRPGAGDMESADADDDEDEEERLP